MVILIQCGFANQNVVETVFFTSSGRLKLKKKKNKKKKEKTASSPGHSQLLKVCKLGMGLHGDKAMK